MDYKEKLCDHISTESTSIVSPGLVNNARENVDNNGNCESELRKGEGNDKFSSEMKTQVSEDSSVNSISNETKDLLITMKIFCKAFPFHFICDSNLQIVQLGEGLLRIFGGGNRAYGTHISSYFSFQKPEINQVNYQSLVTLANIPFIIKVLDPEPEAKPKNLELKGQIITCPESFCLLFLGSPVVDGLESLTSRGLYLSDIPIHDATRDIILVEEQSRAQESLKRRMDKLRESIQQANEAVAMERKKNVDLLNLIFPAQVAKKLWLSEQVEAQQYDDVTMLFSDIVGFTAICSNATPMMVINMLNALYTQFDSFCGEIDVYKIETIGDAYCVAAGLHRPSDIHAQQAAWMALKMINAVNTVLSPTGLPLQMRIGLHTGSVLAGIVGIKMPRYCLFGNNVSLANKFESQSEPMRVNISPTTYRLLSSRPGFKFTERSRDCLPPGFPPEIPGNGYFVDDYKHSGVDAKESLAKHIGQALIDNQLTFENIQLQTQEVINKIAETKGVAVENIMAIRVEDTVMECNKNLKATSSCSSSTSCGTNKANNNDNKVNSDSKENNKSDNKLDNSTIESNFDEMKSSMSRGKTSRTGCPMFFK
uniref:guanylate cyclase n=2 Tax=Tetranychus urticae TaxID=32264 RepID=T1KFI7_TETUR